MKNRAPFWYLQALKVLLLACVVTPYANAATTVPGAPTIASGKGSNASAYVAFTAPSSNGGSTITGYTATCTPTSGTALSATGTSSPLTVSSMTNGKSYSCSVKATNAIGTGTASSTVSVTPLSFSTPSNFETLVAQSYSSISSLKTTTTLTNRARYMISTSSSATASKFLSIGSTYSTAGYSVSSGTLTSASTYKDYLNKTIQFVTDPKESGYYRLDSHLHPNNSLDFASVSSAKFRNNFGKANITTSPKPGYVSFSYDSSTGYLKARKRYTYTYAYSSTYSGYVATYALNTTYSSKYLNYSSSTGTYTLSSTPTKFYLYATPLSLDIPSFMNSSGTSTVTNGAVPFKIKVSSTSGAETMVQTDLKSSLTAQVAYTGTNASTKTAATTQLTAIIKALTSCGQTLRYSADVYTAFRDALLATKLVSDSIADGTPGQNLVPFVYFTNEYATDTSTTCGKAYHPMMVVVSYGNQASPNGLKDVPHPPASGTTDYDNSLVTRYSNLENYMLPIPMKDYGQVTAVTDNTFTKNLWIDESKTTQSKNVYNWADSADNGILVDGSVMFPLYNNALYPSPYPGELSASGCHVGQGGGGPHCHGDGYQSGQGLTLYNNADYVGKTHPPLIGFGYDGIALFGRYRTTTDAAMLGYNTLDDFGGHNHNSIGYHYHAHTLTNFVATLPDNSTKTISEIRVLMKGAYIGKTTSIPYFRTSTSPPSSNKYIYGSSN
jgi:hypothetical protein